MPAGVVATLLLVITLLFGHNGLNASAMTGMAGGSLNDCSVSSLVALDSAVEAVAARVSPAVVNVAVTSRGSEEERAARRERRGKARSRVCLRALRSSLGPVGRLAAAGPGSGRRGSSNSSLWSMASAAA